MTEETRSLWLRLEPFPLDEQNAQFPFTRRLARENGWSAGYAERVVREYKRFLLLAVTRGHTVTPSDQVDQAWHLHLLYTDSYWRRLCRELLGIPLHHGPTRGGAAQGAFFRAAYEQTLQSYAATFDEPAPCDIWPPTSERFGCSSYVRVNKKDHWVLPKPRLRHVLWLLPGLPGCSASDFSGLASIMIVLWFWFVSATMRIRLSERRQPAKDNEPLDLYELAYLAAGDERALVRTALVRLVSAGVCEWSRGEAPIHVRSALPADAHPAERALFARFEGESATFSTLVQGASLLPVQRTMLMQRGVLIRHVEPNEARWLAFFLPSAGLACSAVFMLFQLASKQRLDSLGLAITSGIFLLLTPWMLRKRYRTNAGDQRLRAAWKQNAELASWSKHGVLARLPLALALFGAAALTGSPLDGLRDVLAADASKRGPDVGCGCDGQDEGDATCGG